MKFGRSFASSSSTRLRASLDLALFRGPVRRRLPVHELRTTATTHAMCSFVNSPIAIAHWRSGSLLWLLMAAAVAGECGGAGRADADASSRLHRRRSARPSTWAGDFSRRFVLNA